jgi:polar amino acid transport system permease protein
MEHLDKYLLNGLEKTFIKMIDINYVVEITPYIVDGLKITLIVFIITLFFSIPLGLILASISNINNRFIDYLIMGYTWLFRGTPLLLQLYFGMYGLPVFGITLSRLQVALLIFVLNYGAYFTEIFRGSINSISIEQTEVSKVLGFNRIQIYCYIILPQALKRSIQAVSNEVITLVKDTALVAAIALNDVLRNAKEVVSRDFRVEAFLVVTVIYIGISFIVVKLSKKVERRFAYYR